MKCLIKLKQFIYHTYSCFVSHAFLVEGTLKDSNVVLKCLFIDNSGFTSYAMTSFFTGTPRIVKLCRVFTPFIKLTVKHYSNVIDMCVAVIPNKYNIILKDNSWFKTSEYVNQNIDVSIPWDHILDKFHRNQKEVIRKVKKYNLSYIISNDIDDFNNFYYNMHIPLINKQHNGYVDLDSYENMKKYFDIGFLLFVIHENKAVAGGLFHKTNDRLFFRRIGVLNVDENLQKKGVQTAVYYFAILYAHENNYKTIDIMKSRPFLKDGVYRHKSGWGAVVSLDKESLSSIFFIIPNYSESVTTFFNNNPTIINTDDGLAGLVGSSHDINLNTADDKIFLDRLHTPGLKRIFLIDSKTHGPKVNNFYTRFTNQFRKY